VRSNRLGEIGDCNRRGGTPRSKNHLPVEKLRWVRFSRPGRAKNRLNYGEIEIRKFGFDVLRCQFSDFFNGLSPSHKRPSTLGPGWFSVRLGTTILHINGSLARQAVLCWNSTSTISGDTTMKSKCGRCWHPYYVRRRHRLMLNRRYRSRRKNRRW
jgi:hypothetical protein